MATLESPVRAAREPALLELTIYGCDLDEAAVFREKAPYFGITPVITAAAVSPGTVALAAGNSCISVSHKSPLTNADLAALSDAGVRYISSRSIGLDHIDVDFAQSVGIRVEGAAYSPDSVADFTLMLMLMAVRHVAPTLRRADAHDYRLHDLRGAELRDLTVGVVGTGRIGSAVIDRLRGFGCRILAHDRRQSAPVEKAPFEKMPVEKAAVEYVSFDELLERSDIVTLHAPLDASTRHLMDRRAFARLRNGAYLVNTARGPLVDTDALVAALESGRLAGAALDVVEGADGIFYADQRHRPLDDSPLARLHALPNAIVTPHTAYFTEHALSDVVANSLINCLRFAKGLRHD
jgi:D-specific alpha-keto acid dehydrogenase